MANIIAFHTGALAEYPVVEAIRRIARAGYGGVELNAETLPWARPHVTPNLSAAERQAIRAATLEAGITVTAISAHIGLIDADPARRRAAIAFSKECADLACDLGVDIIHGLTGVVPAGVKEEDAWGWAESAIAEIADHCATRGVKYGIEPVIGMLVSNSAGVARLMADLTGHALGINLDPSHLQVEGDEPAAVARRFAGQIVAVHLKDAKGTPSDFEFPPLGRGAVDFAALSVALHESGYTGPLAVEYEAQVYGGYALSEEEILDGSLDFVRHHFAT